MQIKTKIVPCSHQNVHSDNWQLRCGCDNCTSHTRLRGVKLINHSGKLAGSSVKRNTHAPCETAIPFSINANNACAPRDRPKRGQWVYASCLLLRTAQASTRWFQNSCCIFLKWNSVKSMKMIKLLLLTTQVNCRQNAEQNKRERDYMLHKYLQHADITYDRMLEAQKGPSSRGKQWLGRAEASLGVAANGLSLDPGGS